MRVPLSWLQDFTPIELDVPELTELLSDLGLAVESVDTVGEDLTGVVVSKVLEVRPIAGADRIRAVTVDAGGSDVVQVVCGAWNFDAGATVPLATVGAVLPGGFTIGRRRMKGVESAGMLCSPEELGLPGEPRQILILSDGLEPGTPLADAMGLRPDVVFDLEVNPNRPDAMSVAGVARDVAARLGLAFSLPEAVVPGTDPPVTTLATVEVLVPERCGRFLARVLSDVVVGPSPPWLANRLAMAGMRAINNVVDASNYVMLELGVPNHAYDLTRLPGRGLRVRLAGQGETLVTLDAVERRLTSDDLLICDAADTPVGIAGIMGGASSEIDGGTSEVLLEAAWWAPLPIARTSKRLGLRSEASARFERGTDPEMIPLAVERFCALLAGAKVAAGTIDVVGQLPPRPQVRLRTERVNAVLGTSLSDDQVTGYLEPLGFSALPVGPGLHDVIVPSWRPDSAIEIDLIEEVARLHGYGAIAKTVPPSGARAGRLTPHQRGRRLVRQVLAGAGASEAWTPTFLSGAALERSGLDPTAALVVANPLVAEERFLRPTLAPGLLGAISYNASRRNRSVELFEIGHVFRTPTAASQALPDEREMVAVAMTGSDAIKAAGLWSLMVDALGLVGSNLAPAEQAGLHPTRSAVISVGNGPIGVVGEIDPGILERFAIGERVAWLEVELDPLLAARSTEAEFRPVSRFPSSDIDLAFEIDESTPAADVAQTLSKAGQPLVASVRLFDVYRGDPVLPGRRSLAFTIRFQADDRTLTDAEVATARQRLVDAVESTHTAHLR